MEQPSGNNHFQWGSRLFFYVWTKGELLHCASLSKDVTCPRKAELLPTCLFGRSLFYLGPPCLSFGPHDFFPSDRSTTTVLSLCAMRRGDSRFGELVVWRQGVFHATAPLGTLPSSASIYLWRAESLDTTLKLKMRRIIVCWPQSDYICRKKKALSFLARQFTQVPTWFFGCHLNDFWTRARVADIVFRHVISYEFWRLNLSIVDFFFEIFLSSRLGAFIDDLISGQHTILLVTFISLICKLRTEPSC